MNNNAIEWTEDHSVGVAVIDDQHKTLLDLTNKLFYAILESRGIEAVKEILGELADYADYHFSFEEEVLRVNGYPESAMAPHIAEHRALTKQVEEFRKEIGKQDALDYAVFNFLRDWTTEHLNSTDKTYTKFLNSKGIR